MNRRTRLLIGASLLAVGAATFWIAATQAQGDVRYVQDVMSAPEAHAEGTFTLVAVPQPKSIPVTAPGGVTLQGNPAWREETRRSTTWTRDGTEYFSLHVTSTAADAAGSLTWT